MTTHPRRYAILGAGALGAYYGARLAHAGCDVHFLLRSDYGHVTKHGLTVESTEGDFSLSTDRIHAYRDVRDMPPCHAVCVCMKTTDNHALAELIPPVLADDGHVVMIQNGLGIEAPVAALVGDGRVIGALAFLCSNKVGPGHIRHLDYGKLKFGRYAADGRAAGVDQAMRAIGDDFERAGLPVELADDLVLARWQKLVWNVPYNGLSVTLDAQTDELMGNPLHRALVEKLMREVVAAAAACGRTIGDDFVQLMLDHTEKMTPYRTSMKIDYDERRSLEVEAIFGNPLRAAEAHGATLPEMRTLYEQLKTMDQRNRATQ